jgi:hypothetical protein
VNITSRAPLEHPPRQISAWYRALSGGRLSRSGTCVVYLCSHFDPCPAESTLNRQNRESRNRHNLWPRVRELMKHQHQVRFPKLCQTRRRSTGNPFQEMLVTAWRVERFWSPRVRRTRVCPAIEVADTTTKAHQICSSDPSKDSNQLLKSFGGETTISICQSC